MRLPVRGCDECRRGLLRAALAGGVSLVVPGCGGGSPDGERDGGAGGADAGTDAAGADATGLDASADRDSEGGGAVEAGECDAACTATASTLSFSFSAYPQLKNVGGSAVGHAPGYSDPTCNMDVVIVAQVSAGSYVAFSAACSHQCCTVGYDQAVSEFVCPCHGSTYDQAGRVTGGPAPTGLTALPVCVDGCGVHVTYG